MPISTTKRAAGAALVFGATALLFSACAAASTGSESAELTWTTQANVAPETIDAVVEQFESENPGVTVKVERLADDDLKNTVRTQLAAGGGPDIFTVWPGTEGLLSVQDLAKNGMLAELDELKWASEAEPGSLAAGTVDGKLFMVTPGYASTGAIYNLDSVETAGLEVPETWSELLAFCADAKAAGTTAFGLGLQDGWTARLIPLSFLANEIDDVEAWNAALMDGSFDFTESEEWRTALTREQEMYEAGCFNDSPVGTSTGDTVLPGVINGDFLGLISVSAHIGVMEGQSEEDLRFDIVPLPSSDDPEASRLQITYANGIGVNAKSENLEMAKKLAETFGEVANVNSFSSELGLLPSIINDEFEVPASLAATAELVKAGRSAGGDWSPGDDTVNARTNGIQALYLGDTSIDTVLQDMQSAYQAYITG